MDKNVRDALSQTHIFKKIFGSVVDILSLASTNDEWLDKACRIQFNENMYESNIVLNYLYSPDVVDIPQDKLPIFFEEELRKTRRNRKFQQCSTFDQILTIRARAMPSQLEQFLEPNIAYFQYYLDSNSTFRILELALKYDRLQTLFPSPFNFCYIVSRLKSSKIMSINGLCLMELINYLEDQPLKATSFLDGFPNVNFLRIQIDVYHASNKLDKTYYRNVARMFENRKNFSICLHLNDNSSQKVKEDVCNMFKNIYEAFRDAKVNLIFAFKGLSVTPDIKLLAYEPLAKIHISNLESHGRVEYLLDTLNLIQFFNDSFKDRSKLANLKEFVYAGYTQVFLTQYMEQFIRHLAKAPNLSIIRLEVVSTLLRRNVELRAEECHSLKLFVWKLPKFIKVLHLSGFPIILESFNGDIGRRFTDLKELKYVDLYRSNEENHFPTKYFKSFKRLELLHINCVKKNYLRVKQKLRVVVISGCFTDIESLQKQYQLKLRSKIIQREIANQIQDSFVFLEESIESEDTFIANNLCNCSHFEKKLRNVFKVKKFLSNNKFQNTYVFCKHVIDFSRFWSSLTLQNRLVDDNIILRRWNNCGLSCCALDSGDDSR
uniref:Uncharacterized protein n=1 Tax=Rhabditophanes sp. KR3021 TaxID=114890 RepID=A0AC35TNC9_9BILA